LNTDNNMGNLDLTDQEIDDIIAFLMALTDL
jgi:cytochrome c1